MEDLGASSSQLQEELVQEVIESETMSANLQEPLARMGSLDDPMSGQVAPDNKNSTNNTFSLIHPQSFTPWIERMLRVWTSDPIALVASLVRVVRTLFTSMARTSARVVTGPSLDGEVEVDELTDGAPVPDVGVTDTLEA
ncbi:hypothetical protein R1sor_009410 [Riccia sorocarpa]|uniref:Uncharacterized protein n=1 Tax=Riccia sorocarpa TaxID=122646 RepID=A0ABD3HX19_9MARC